MDLTDEVGQVERSSPSPSDRTRRAAMADPRDVLSAILWILRTGAPWADLPRRYPPYQTCHDRFHKWEREGVLD